MTRQPTQPLVAVDIGNSHLSAALFLLDEQGKPLPAKDDFPTQVRLTHGDFPGSQWQPVVESWAPRGDLQWFVSSVHRPCQDSLLQWLQQKRPIEAVQVLRFQDLPLSIEVDRPEQVGMDRLAAAVAVNQLRSTDRPALLIDCGSAVTCDLISAAGVFQGGAILPGWHLATQVLAEQTDQLPLVACKETPPEVVGRSTDAAISSGVYWGTLGALREIVARMSQSLTTEPEKFLTGAGSIWREQLVQEQFREVSDLVITGVAFSGAYLISQERLQENG